MINANMRSYNYSIIEGKDNYGQAAASTVIKGSVKMAITISSQSIQDNILYKNCAYVGLTLDNNIDDTYIIKYGKERLKVLYVNPMGRYKQVFMSVYE
jgi:hypothetical protein